MITKKYTIEGVNTSVIFNLSPSEWDVKAWDEDRGMWVSLNEKLAPEDRKPANLETLIESFEIWLEQDQAS